LYVSNFSANTMGGDAAAQARMKNGAALID